MQCNRNQSLQQLSDLAYEIDRLDDMRRLVDAKLGKYLTARYGSVGEGKEKLGGGLKFVREVCIRMREGLYWN